MLVGIRNKLFILEGRYYGHNHTRTPKPFNHNTVYIGYSILIGRYWSTKLIFKMLYHHKTWSIADIHSLLASTTRTCTSTIYWHKTNRGNAKRGISPRLNIWSSDLDIWPWKSIGFQILLRTKYVPSLVKIHWRMLILECSQECYEGRKEALLYPLATSLARG